MTTAPGLLLDTCALIYSVQGEFIKPAAVEAINAASRTGRLFISPISAWEIGMSLASGRLASPLAPLEFFSKLLRDGGCKLCGLSPEILLTVSFLPGKPHGDPADRMFIATARMLDLILVTRDRAILAYGSEGHVRTLAC